MCVNTVPAESSCPVTMNFNNERGKSFTMVLLQIIKDLIALAREALPETKFKKVKIVSSVLPVAVGNVRWY